MIKSFCPKNNKIMMECRRRPPTRCHIFGRKVASERNYSGIGGPTAALPPYLFGERKSSAVVVMGTPEGIYKMNGRFLTRYTRVYIGCRRAHFQPLHRKLLPTCWSRRSGKKPKVSIGITHFLLFSCKCRSSGKFKGDH